MSLAIQGIAHHLDPRREERLQRSEAIAGRLGASNAPTTTPVRRLSIPRIVTAWLSRRPMVGLPRQVPRHTADSGVSPFSSGASRGIALLVSR